MRHKKDGQKNSMPVKKSGIAAIVVFLIILLVCIMFTANDFPGTHYFFKEGQISREDVYAPFDFSFRDAGGKTVDVIKNELIVERGKRIDKTQELATVQLDSVHRESKNWYYFLGICSLLIIFAVIIVTYASVYMPPALFETKNIVLLCLLTLLITLAAKAIIMVSWPLYLIPLASMSMLTAILIDPGIALMMTLVAGIFIGVLTGLRFDMVLIMLAGGVVSIYSVLNVRRRRDLTKAGFLIGLTNMMAIIVAGLINFVSINDLVVESSWGLLNGIASAIIVNGVLNVFEIVFGITTNISLLELSDLNQPVLKELVLKAPGTYHHSLVVGNLSESAAEAVGANTLLARVGAYFHDIGKLRMATYFSENQPQAENKHDNLSPTISSLIIINHIKEGADLAKKYRLGKAIYDIIIQHHGNDVVHYFYHRALEQRGVQDNMIQAEDFRYPGPKPQSKEAAIVMLADSVEAASRAIPQPTPEKIKDLVHRIINNKFIDGQLDDCNLTLKDLHDISGVFIHILNGIFHTRVEYPDPK